METCRLIHLSTGRVVAHVQRAGTAWAKGWGVLGRSTMPVGEGLWLPGVASVHTLFVRFPLDLLFLDAEFRTVRLAPQTLPWQWSLYAPAACHTIELGEGTLAGRVPEAKMGDGWVLERVDEGNC